MTTTIASLLDLATRPVAVAFRDRPPEGLPRVEHTGPSGCTYWKLAAEGRSFYTEARDHHECPIGAYTHGVELPPEKAKELEALIGTMVGLSYLRPEEVPSIPRREEPFGVVLYGPWPGAPFEPEVILVRADARRTMLLGEAALRAGLGHDAGLMLRPTCAILPATLRGGRAATSLGCIGNRVYTGLGDGEMYFAIPGRRAADLVRALEEIVAANRALAEFHESRKIAVARRA
jgi:uncharacterized protein (DUF169 family)